MAVDLNKVAGAIMITTFVGLVIWLDPTGSYKTCKGGWILLETGMYECPSRDIDPQWCHHGSDEGPENIGYRCYLGEVVEEARLDNVPSELIPSSQDFTMDPDEVHCYVKGNLLWKGELKDGDCIR